jgi:ADP-ribosyl-[dinitrogen reductase] hydrolase
VRNSSHVHLTLEVALWAFERTGTFQEGCLLVVNLGNDADTCAAVYGQIAGAFYGLSGIPEHWLGKLCKRDMLVQMADHLL